MFIGFQLQVIHVPSIHAFPRGLPPFQAKTLQCQQNQPYLKIPFHPINFIDPICIFPLYFIQSFKAIHSCFFQDLQLFYHFTS